MLHVYHVLVHRSAEQFWGKYRGKMVRTVTVQGTEIFTRDLHEVEGWLMCSQPVTQPFLIWSSLTFTISLTNLIITGSKTQS